MFDVLAFFTVFSPTFSAARCSIGFTEITQAVLLFTGLKLQIILEETKMIKFLYFTFGFLLKERVYLFLFVEGLPASFLEALSCGKLVCLAAYVAQAAFLAKEVLAV